MIDKVLIGNNIKEQRIKRHWKFEYVSKNTNIDIERLKLLENGKRIPTYEELFKISRLYNVIIDVIVYGEDYKNK